MTTGRINQVSYHQMALPEGSPTDVRTKARKGFTCGTNASVNRTVTKARLSSNHCTDTPLLMLWHLSPNLARPKINTLGEGLARKIHYASHSPPAGYGRKLDSSRVSLKTSYSY
jgi:hypothetical protein